MNNLEWLYREDEYLNSFAKLMAMAHGYATDEFTANEWLMAQHEDANDDFMPESVVTGEIVDANDANARVTTMPLKMPSEIKVQYVDDESCNQVADQCEHTETPPARKWQSNDAQSDSREKLEADVRKNYSYTVTTLMYPPSANKNTDMLKALPVDTVIGWLDRQASITSKEWCWTNDSLQEQVNMLTEQRDHWHSNWTERNAEYNDLADEYDKLEAERDEWKRKVEEEKSDAKRYWENANNIAKERDEWKAKAESALHENPYVGLVRGKQWERTEISDYYCGRCGWKVTDHDSYCPECGGALHRTSNKPDSKFDARKTAETPETDAAKGDIRDFDDSREKLEEELHNILHCAQITIVAKAKNEPFDWYTVDGYIPMICELFDRQAAITERECLVQSVQGADAILTAENAELTNQLESAHAKNRALKAHIAKMQEGRHGWHIKGKELQQQVDTMRDVIREFRDERDHYIELFHEQERRANELQSRDANIAREIGTLRAERDRYRELCGKLLDAADEMRRVRDAFDQFERGEA